MGDGWGWWWLFGSIWMVVFWGLIIWGVITIVGRLGRHDEAERGRGRPTPLEILDERYARGELTTNEFEERRDRLRSGPAP